MNVTELYPNHDPNVLFLYEIIGSYFTDIIFNHIYHNTVIKLPKGASLADEYIKRLQLYIIGLKNDKKCYENTIIELNKYYNTVMNSNINITSFISIIIDSCVPNNFVQQLNQQNKAEIVNNIICDLIGQLITFASMPKIITKITVNHKQNAPEIVKLLQDYAIQSIINKKLDILNKFIKQTGEVKTETPGIINELKNVIRKLLNEKNELVTEYETKLKQYEDNESASTEREQKLRKFITLLQEQYNNIMQKYNECQTMLSDVRALSDNVRSSDNGRPLSSSIIQPCVTEPVYEPSRPVDRHVDRHADRHVDRHADNIRTVPLQVISIQPDKDTNQVGDKIPDRTPNQSNDSLDEKPLTISKVNAFKKIVVNDSDKDDTDKDDSDKDDSDKDDSD